MKIQLKLLIVFLGSGVLRALQSVSVSEPQLMSDEYSYKTIALHFFKGDKVPVYQGKLCHIRFPNYLYELLISPVFAVGENYLALTRILNAFLISTSVIPIYLILRKVMDSRLSLAWTALVMLLPSFGLSILFLPENIYLPLALVLVERFLTFLEEPKRSTQFQIAIVFALCYLAKPHALYVGFGLFLTACTPLCRRNVPFKKFVELGLMVAFAFFIAQIPYDFLFEKEVSPVGKLDFGTYGQHFLRFFTINQEVLYVFFWTTVHNFLHVSFFLFFPFCLLCYDAWKATDISNQQRCVARCIWILFVTTLLVTLKFTADMREIDSIHERYYFVSIPLVLGYLGSFRAQRIGLNKWARSTAAVGIITVLFYYLYFQNHGQVGDGCSAQVPEGCFMHSLGIRNLPLRIFALGLLGILFLQFKHKRFQPKQVIAYLLIFLIAGNVGKLRWDADFDQGIKSHLKDSVQLTRELITEIHPTVTLVDPSYTIRLHYGFHFDFDYQSVVVLPEKSRIGPEHLAKNSSYVILLGEYEIDFPFKTARKSGKAQIIKL